MADEQATQSTFVELLCALSYAADLGMGQPMQHGLKAAYIGVRLADRLGLSAEERGAIYCGALLKDSGCTSHAVQFASLFVGDELAPRQDFFLLNPEKMTQVIAWFMRHATVDASLPGKVSKLFSFFVDGGALMKECATAHCEVAEMFAGRLGFDSATQQAVRYLYEQWNGKGMVYGTRGPDIPITARVLHLTQAVEVAHQLGSRAAAEAMALERRGGDFDPAVVDAFLDACKAPAFWEPVENDQAADDLMAMAPPAARRTVGDAEVEIICGALADFADIKARRTWHHSTLVAETSAAMSQRLGLDAPETNQTRRAALVHDVGKAAIPCSALVKEGPLTEAEQEKLRLHPYYSERVLRRIAALRELAPVAAAHHESFDGTGFHRQLAREQIPIGGRILAVADAYAHAFQQQPDADRVLAELHRTVGSTFDPGCYEALAGVVGATDGRVDEHPRERASVLSDRELEVLREVAQGHKNRQIAATLVISEKTVEHHLRHIYDKLGVTCRTAAVVFGVQNGLV